VDKKGFKRALLFGSSGLVGSNCLNELLASHDYSKVYAPTRRVLDQKSDKLINPVIDFEKIDSSHEKFRVDDLYCCLGTTKAKAKSLEAFIHIDSELVVKTAELAFHAGCKRMVYISSMGASKDAFSNYLKIKARTERALTDIGFETLHIIRPSILLGDRAEERKLESMVIRMMNSTSFIFNGPFLKYRPVQAHQVAKFMLACMAKKEKGVFIHESGEIV